MNLDRICAFQLDLLRLYTGRVRDGAEFLRAEDAIELCRERGGEEEAAVMKRFADIAKTLVGWPAWEKSEKQASACRLVAYAHSGNSGRVGISEERVADIAQHMATHEANEQGK